MSKISELQQKAKEFEQAATGFAENEKRKSEALDDAIDEVSKAHPLLRAFRALMRMFKS